MFSHVYGKGDYGQFDGSYIGQNYCYGVIGADHNLKKVVLSENLEEIPIGLFNIMEESREKGYNGIDSIKIPSKVKKIGGGAFIGCTKLTEIDLKNVTKVGGDAFAGCTGLTKINLENVTEIGDWAFEDCTSLPEIDLSKVTKLGSCVFEGWTSNQKIKVPFASTDSLPSGWDIHWNRYCNAQIIYTDS